MPTTRYLIALAAALLAASLIGGCGASSPIRLHERPAGAVTYPLEGTYTATVRAPFVGPVRARLSAEPHARGGGFAAASRPGVAWDMIGGLQGFLGPIFAPHLFPSGIILVWVSPNPSTPSPPFSTGPASPDGRFGEGWINIGGFRSLGARTRISGFDNAVELLTPEGRRVAVMMLEPTDPDSPPPADYRALAAAADAAFRARLYDGGLARSFAARAYLGQVRSSAALARDDVEFIFGTVVAARNHLKISLPIVIPRPDGQSMALAADVMSDPRLATVRASFDRRTRIATLRADAFLDAADVDAAFERILAWNPRGLLIDIRSCPGVTLASLRIASWLIDAPAEAGGFFGQEHRSAGLAGRFDGFPRLELSSAASVAEIEAQLDAEGRGMVVVHPHTTTFRGPIAVLTSKRTTTSAEPLAWLLKSIGRARLFGETTVGRPTISRPVDIGQGWDFWIPAFDYSPPNGERFSDRGVAPDVEGSRDASRIAALRYLREEAREMQRSESQQESP